MASFWENFREAMGWGKANHTQHLSDISEDERDQYRSQHVASKLGYKSVYPGKNANLARDRGDGNVRLIPIEYEAPSTVYGEYPGDANVTTGKGYILATGAVGRSDRDISIHGMILDNGQELDEKQAIDFLNSPNAYRTLYKRASQNKGTVGYKRFESDDATFGKRAYAGKGMLNDFVKNLRDSSANSNKAKWLGGSRWEGGSTPSNRERGWAQDYYSFDEEAADPDSVWETFHF